LLSSFPCLHLKNAAQSGAAFFVARRSFLNLINQKRPTVPTIDRREVLKPSKQISPSALNIIKQKANVKRKGRKMTGINFCSFFRTMLPQIL